MSAESTQTMPERSELVTAEHRLQELGITLPAPPEPFGTYAEAVQTNNLLFLTGMLPTQGRGAAFIGRLGAELDVDTRDRVPRNPGAARGAVVAEADGGGVEFRRPRVVWRPLLGTSGDQRRDRADPLPHLEAIRDQSVGLNGGRRCPDIG